MSRAPRVLERRVGSIRVSAGPLNGQKLPSHGSRKVHERALRSGKQIVLSALIDDTDQTVLRGPRVWQRPINLAANQRGLIPLIVQTERELGGPSFHG